MVLLALLLLLQQEQKVPRADKLLYVEAVQRCREGEALMASDPERAIARFDEILRDPKIRKTECVLLIEDRSGDTLPAYNFFPYQYRGRALLASARGDATILARAVADLERSVDAGVVSSQEFLKAAKTQLAKAKASAPAAPPTGVPIEISTEWERLLDAGKFKSALDLASDPSRAIPESDRVRMKEETRRQDKARLDSEALAYRKRLTLLGDLSKVEEQDLIAILAVPETAESIASCALLDWGRAHQRTFVEAGKGRKTGASLLAAAIQAGAIPEPVAFAAAERAGYFRVRSSLTGLLALAKDAPRAEREKLQSLVAAEWTPWKKLVEGLSAEERRGPIDEHTRELERLAGSMPADVAELAKVDLSACLLDDDPCAAFRRSEVMLESLEPRVALAAIESRQKYYSLLVASRAMRTFLSGGNVEEAVRGARPLADPLRASGGPADPARWGPRVQAVFEALR